MNRAIILAAGMGTRLVSGFDFPKPLKRVHGVPLVVRVLRGLERAGVTDVGVVVGYLGDTLIERLRRYRFALDLRFVVNDQYEKPNGTSLLKAAALVRGPTYVVMSDHLWSPRLIEAVSAFPLGGDEAVLGVDFRIDRCFDLEDATKVELDGEDVVDIGKELLDYQAIDTGMFRVTPALIDALGEVESSNGCTLSEGVAVLARRGKMRVVDIGGATWIDVDTPKAHRIAESLIHRFGDDLATPDDLPAAMLASGS